MPGGLKDAGPDSSGVAASATGHLMPKRSIALNTRRGAEVGEESERGTVESLAGWAPDEAARLFLHSRCFRDGFVPTRYAQRSIQSPSSMRQCASRALSDPRHPLSVSLP